MSDNLKAYVVRESGEGHACVVFAVSGAPARRHGASELGTDWDRIETCRRAPEFDAYAPGPVPQRALYDAGWWLECWHCDYPVNKDAVHEFRSDDEGNDADPGDFGFYQRGKLVFCCAQCAAQHDAGISERERRERAVIEAALLKFPQATSATAFYSSGAGRDGWIARLDLPGMAHGAEWLLGSTDVWVTMSERETFVRLYGGQEGGAG